MPPDNREAVTPRDHEEYSALRATIRTRGTTRVLIAVVGSCVWAALWLTSTALDLPPLSMLASLLILAAAFEAVFALHVGIERIGRYLQVFHDDRWERVAMDFGPPSAGAGSDPLFTILFALATSLNFIPVIAAGAVQVELVVIGTAHALLIARVLVARLAASRQRAADLDRFRAMKRAS